MILFRHQTCSIREEIFGHRPYRDIRNDHSLRLPGQMAASEVVQIIRSVSGCSPLFPFHTAFLSSCFCDFSLLSFIRILSNEFLTDLSSGQFVLKFLILHLQNSTFNQDSVHRYQGLSSVGIRVKRL